MKGRIFIYTKNKNEEEEEEETRKRGEGGGGDDERALPFLDFARFWIRLQQRNRNE